MQTGDEPSPKGLRSPFNVAGRSLLVGLLAFCVVCLLLQATIFVFKQHRGERNTHPFPPPLTEQEAGQQREVRNAFEREKEQSATLASNSKALEQEVGAARESLSVSSQRYRLNSTPTEQELSTFDAAVTKLAALEQKLEQNQAAARSHDILLSKADTVSADSLLQSALETGEVAFRVNSRMRLLYPESVRVVVSRKSIVNAVKKTLLDQGFADFEPLVAGQFMRVELSAPETDFAIKAVGPVDRLLGENPEEWIYDVVPKSTGKDKVLTATVFVRFLLPNRVEYASAKVLDKHIVVQVDWLASAENVMAGNWQYFVSGFGGVVVSIASFYGVRWADQKPRQSRKRSQRSGSRRR